MGQTGAQIFHTVLASHEVSTVFGYPGGAILPVFDAIHESPHFHFILSRHEQGAGHMAQGYARVSSKPGIVLVTSGPGATNVVTSMQDALMDGTPMIVFTGQVATSVLGTDAFQEADVLGITRPCTKWNVQVRRVEDLVQCMNAAFHIATTGRPGPVLVDLPKDITAGICRSENVTIEPQLLGYYGQTKVKGNRTCQENALMKAATLLNAAEKPLLYVGQGAMHAAEAIRHLAISANVPVTTSLQGLGVFDECDPLSLHMVGMHGSVYANKAMQSADVIVAIGARFDDRVTGRVCDFAPAARKAHVDGTGGIIHLEISEKQVNKIIPVTVPIIGDAQVNVTRLTELVTSKPRTAWHLLVQSWKAQYPFRYRPSTGNALMKPQRVIEELYTQTKDYSEIYLTTGVGQHQMWAAQFFRWRQPKSMITSGGLGTMGFGLPAALGAQAAAPHALVCIDTNQ